MAQAELISSIKDLPGEPPEIIWHNVLLMVSAFVLQKLREDKEMLVPVDLRPGLRRYTHEVFILTGEDKDENYARGCRVRRTCWGTV